MRALRVAVPCLLLAFWLGACADADPTARLTHSIEAHCELADRCGALPDWITVEECFDDQQMILATIHEVYGGDCIDAYVAQVECRIEYDCEMGGELEDQPCEHLVEPAERACGGFAAPPDLGIGPDADQLGGGDS